MVHQTVYCREMAAPPSTNKLAPVQYFAISEAKKTTGCAMSSGSPSRPSGMRLLMSSLFFGFAKSSLLMLVSIVPAVSSDSVVHSSQRITDLEEPNCT